MTNAQIIYNAQCELMEKGIIGTTGRKFEAIDMDGNKVIVDEPEEIHTYAAWIARGFQVQKGEKAIAKITIWKHAVKKAKSEDEAKMFMKTAAFFSRSQVEAIAT